MTDVVPTNPELCNEENSEKWNSSFTEVDTVQIHTPYFLFRLYDL